MTSTEIERAQQQIEADRARIGETVSEMRQLVHDRTDRAKQAVDPRTYVRQHPWIALGLVLGAGIAVAMTGVDRKAARGVAQAGGAIGEKAGDAKDLIVEKMKGDEPDPLIYADGGAEGPIHRPLSVGQRLLGAVDDVVYRAFEPVLNDMRQTVDAAPWTRARALPPAREDLPA